MTYFDFHTHAFVDSLAERAVGALAETSDIKPFTDGTISGLLAAMDSCGIERAMLLPVATKPSQQTNINNWAAQVMNNRLYCCGSVHPDAEDSCEEVSRIKSLGLYGVKFHPEYQYFCPDEKRMYPVYEAIERENMLAVFHGGWDPYSKDVIRGTPETFATVARDFPKLKIVVAHLGGMNLWDDVEKHLAGKFENIYLDVSVIAGYIDEKQLERVVRTHGCDKILYGSDCPWSDPKSEIDMINRLSLTEEEREQIFFRNAERLLGLQD